MRLSREQARHCRLWNFIAIDSNATKASEDIPHVGYETADGEKVPDPKHPLAQLFRNVNPVDWWQSFAHEMFMMWGLYRRVVIWMNPNGFGVPAELWVVPTPWAEPKPDRDGQIRFWEITPSSGGVPFKVDAEEILCAQAKHPNSKTVPLSPTEAGAEWIVSSEIVERARHDTYEHGPLQSMMLEIDPEHHQGLTPELLDAIGEKFMARYQGWHKAGRPIVQPPGVKAVPWSVKPNEMLTGETADQLRDNVLALHKTPRSAVGISADLNRASIWGAEHNWYEHALNPMRRFLAGALTEFLASRFEEGLLVWYDDLIPRDVEQERAEIELDFKLGAITPDERRVARGYEPLGTPAAQQTYRPSSQVPLDTPVQQQSASPKEPRDKGDTGDEALADDSEEEPAAGSPQVTASLQNSPRQSQAVRGEGSRTAQVLADWEATHNKSVGIIEPRAQRFFNMLAREVGARIDAGAVIVSDIIPDAIFKAGFNSAMVPAWRASAELGVDFERRACGIERIKQDVTPSIRIAIPPRMQREIDEWVNGRQVGVWKQVEETTRKDIAEAITEGIAAGKGMREIRSKVLEVIRDKNRAATIAQTEATGALNSGAQILRDHQGITQKQWFATFDSHTRATHAAAQGQITDNKGDFVVGGYRMKHPGDSSLGAPAAEVVRCRCCATGYIDTSAE